MSRTHKLTDDAADSDKESSLAGLEVVPGDILAGKYRVTKVLGVGGMGVVVEATHMDLDEQVALKFLNPSLVHKDEATVTRFQREAKMAAKIKSEHVARVRDVGTLESGAPYIVLEYLEGRDLDDEIAACGRVAMADAVLYVLQACEALAHAHSLGIVHRDLKPANLFLARRADGSPAVKVLDFGISKMLSGTTSAGVSLTKTNALIGSPLYLPPECWQSAKNADERSDIFSLATILFELIAGRSAFTGESLPELCRSIQQDMPDALAPEFGDVSPGLDEVIAKAVAKSPSNRHQNIAEFAVAVAGHGRSQARMLARRVVGVMNAADKLDEIPDIVGDSKPPNVLVDTAAQGTPSIADEADIDGSSEQGIGRAKAAPNLQAETAVTRPGSALAARQAANEQATSADSARTEALTVSSSDVPLKAADSRRGVIIAAIVLIGAATIAFALRDGEQTSATTPSATTTTATKATTTTAATTPSAISAETPTTDTTPAPSASASATSTAAPTTTSPQPKSPLTKPTSQPTPQPVVKPQPAPKPIVKPQPADDDIFGQH